MRIYDKSISFSAVFVITLSQNVAIRYIGFPEDILDEIRGSGSDILHWEIDKSKACVLIELTCKLHWCELPSISRGESNEQVQKKIDYRLYTMDGRRGISQHYR